MSRVQLPVRTLVKTGFFSLDLSEVVGRVGWGFGTIRKGLGNVHKYVSYGLRRDPFLLIVSQQIDKSATPQGYNAILTVTSRSDERNSWIAEEFEMRSGVRYGVTPPTELVRQMKMYDWVFPVFLKSPKTALAMWDVRA